MTLAHLATSVLIQAPNSSGRIPDRIEAEGRELLLDVRQRQRLHDLAVQQVDHRPRRIRGQENPDEDVGLLIVEAGLHHRRHRRQRGRPLRAHHREPAHLAAEDARRGGRQCRKADRGVAADGRIHRRAAAGERHMDDVDAVRTLEQFAGEMSGRAGAGGGVAEFARIDLEQRDQLLGRARAEQFMGDDHRRRRAHQRHRREILHRIERRLRIERRIDHEARRDREHRIAVRRGLHRLRHADIAAGTDDVLDIELLLEAFRKFLRDQPRGGVVGAARPDRNDDAHGAARIGLR